MILLLESVQIQLRVMAQVVEQIKVVYLVLALVILDGQEPHVLHQFAHQLVVDMELVLHLISVHVIQGGVDPGVRLNSN